MRSKMSDDFWMKEVSSKEAEERARVRVELENVRTSLNYVRYLEEVVH